MPLCSNDSRLTPVSNCRPFDFTIHFSSALLSILPSALFIVLAFITLYSIRKRTSAIATLRATGAVGRLLWALKIGTLLGLAGAELGVLVGWKNVQAGGTTDMAAFVLSFLSSVIAIPFSHFTHHLTPRSPLLLPSYLLFTILFDAVRLRTFALSGFIPTSFFRAFCAAWGLRVLSFAAENIGKGRLVREFRAQNDGKVDRVPPEEVASFVSRLFFGWATPLLIRGARTALTLDTLDPISSDLDALELWGRGRLVWETELARQKDGKTKHPLLWTLMKAFPEAFFAPILPCVVYAMAIATLPQAINQMIKFIESYTSRTDGGGDPVENGWGLCVAFFLIYFVYGVSYSWFMLSVNRGSSMLRGFLIEAIYRKALVMHVEVARETGSGKTGSMMSLETEKIVLRFFNVYDPISAFVIVFIGLILLHQQLGVSFVATIIGIFFILGAVPLLSRKIGGAQLAWSNATDARQRLSNSVIKNFLPIKLSALEGPLKRVIDGFRVVELTAFGKYWLQLCKVVVVTNLGVNILNVFTLGTYSVVTILNPNLPPLNTARMFTVVAVISSLMMPLNGLGQGYAQIVAAWTSMKRIEGFLTAAETPADQLPSAPASPGSDIIFSDATYGHKEASFLHNITTRIESGKLTLVVGQVGCGKSTLLQACLGELTLLSGSHNLPPAKAAYCSQDPWLRSESIREAILFQSDYDAVWYRRVISALTLDQDFEMLSEGDASLTTALSGGQRQRVALARAVYADAERLLLDDTLSALDSNTEDEVFVALFDPVNGLLRGKTVVLATNGVHRLPTADRIIMLAEGKIAEQGTFDDLMAQDGITAALVRDYKSERAATVVGAKASEKTKDTEDDSQWKKKAVDEEGKRASVGWSVYKFYGAAVGLPRVLVTLLLMAVMGGEFTSTPLCIQIYQNYWSQSIGEDPRGGLRRFFGGYIGLEVVNVFIFSIAIWYSGCVMARAGSKNLHRAAIKSVLAASPSTILKTGAGKVMNRFSSDVFLLDFNLPLAFLNLLSLVGLTIGSVIIISVSAPWVALIIGVVAVGFVVMTRFYGRTSQQLRRLDLGSKTPLYSLLTDTVDADGLRTIRAFGAQEHFRAVNTTCLRGSQRPYYLMNVSRRWLNSTVNFSLAIINTAMVAFAVNSRRSTSAGLLAVALVQATSLTDYLNHMLLSYVELEISIVAIERLKEMIELPAEETPAVLALPPRSPHLDEKGLEKTWPMKGGIRFENVTARYAADAEPVLQALTFNVRAGSRVGIVGRTGSGKSTTLASLFRMIDPDAGGRIIVDGQDIVEVPLQTLRSAMTLIPQDPLLLEMSIRDNLDVTGSARDDELWDAVDKASLKKVIEALPNKLDEIITGSSGFSRGQKQLLALARAIIQNRPIVCLDEATSSIDVETDAAVQRTLRSSFGGATILTIAHRIATIRDYDSIIVLDNGRLAEHGPPDELLKIPGGLFRRLVKGEEEETEAQIEKEVMPLE